MSVPIYVILELRRAGEEGEEQCNRNGFSGCKIVLYLREKEEIYSP